MEIKQEALEAAAMAALNVRRKHMGHPPTTKKQFLIGLPAGTWEEIVEAQRAALEAYEAARALERESGALDADTIYDHVFFGRYDEALKALNKARFAKLPKPQRTRIEGGKS